VGEQCLEQLARDAGGGDERKHDHGDPRTPAHDGQSGQGKGDQRHLRRVAELEHADAQVLDPAVVDGHEAAEPLEVEGLGRPPGVGAEADEREQDGAAGGRPEERLRASVHPLNVADGLKSA
jgi:hypothetical protein